MPIWEKGYMDEMYHLNLRPEEYDDDDEEKVVIAFPGPH